MWDNDQDRKAYTWKRAVVKMYLLYIARNNGYVIKETFSLHAIVKYALNDRYSLAR